jgi:5-formyltetrahydrofolate cyclo-ligase
MGTVSKEIIRKEYLERRRKLSLQESHSMQAMMVAHMEAIRWPTVKYVMSYRSIAKNHELHMHLFEQALLHFRKDFIFCYPRTSSADGTMEAIADDHDTVWGLSSFGVEEPVAGNLVHPKMIDLVFVPLLAFDQKGYRVGYGKGYYDRFLKRCRPDAMTMGLSLFPPLEAIGDIHANDVPLKYCITPHKIYAF